MWFWKLIRQFFFAIDQIVFNFISVIYDLLMSIARTSVLSQTDILGFAERIYALLAVFMIFKVTISLITYVVNPDDFSDKNKGVAKLGTNIIISLSLLILTPYIFNYAYRLQTIVLEENALGDLIFGEESNDSILNTAGDDMAYITMSAFFSPNLSLNDAQNCIELTTNKKDSNGNEKVVFNPACSGYNEDGTTNSNQTLYAMTQNNSNFKETDLKNYIAGVENQNLGLMFRLDLANATDKENENFIMDYKFIFSTIVGVILILLLLTFCMDIGLRSIKLAFLQIVAPIPIISYVDPKSGKDGLFKKWYQMCFKTYLSLFVRILALYFAVYIIDIVIHGRMVDIVNGTYQTNIFVQIFIIVGALMFAKQFPKILEGLGIKLDGDGKFFLNPFKKFEEQAVGAKRLTGAVGGMAAGLIGGHGVAGRLGSAFTGAARGFAANKGYKGGIDRQAEVNRKLREARINGAGFWGSRVAVLSSRYGLDDYDLEKKATALRTNKKNLTNASIEVDQEVKTREAEKKRIQDGMASRKKEVADHKRMQEAISSMEKRARGEIEAGNGGDIGKRYLTLKARAEYLENNIGKKVDVNGKQTLVTPEMVAQAEYESNKWLNDTGMKKYMSEAATGKFSDGTDDKTLQNFYQSYAQAAEILGIEKTEDGAKLHTQFGVSKGEVGEIERSLVPDERKISDIDDAIRNIQTNKTVIIDGKEVKYEDAKAIVDAAEKELNEEKNRRKTNRDAAAARRIGGSK